MTTAYDTFNDGQNGSVFWDSTARTTGTLPWGQGAGHVAPSVAVDPGLVYDLATIDYARFLCGLGITNVFSPGTCSAVGTIQPYNLNLPSLTAANVLGIQTLTRTVKNVGGSAATYNVNAVLPGYTVDVQPATLNLAPGASATYTVKLTRTSAPMNTWVYGRLTWSDGTHTVRSPLTARASTIAVPATVTSEATSGTKVVTIGTGFAGALSLAKAGLIPATEASSTVVKATDTADSVCTGGGGTGVNVHTVSIPAGTTTARFALYDSDTSGNGQSDLDLVVARGTTVVGSSGGQTSNEMVTLTNPPAGDYKVCVVGYAPVGGSATYKLSSWVLSPGTVGGNFKAVAPTQVALGGTASVALSWSGLATGKRHLGSVTYVTGNTAVGMTMVEVDTTDPIPLFQNAGNKQAKVE
ncbi:hypothetical protein NX783_23715 [Massilia kyonggiensis]|nr:hypothetical protein [Massilia kyonggiensis]